jgi:mannose-6-phosphate isomerase-like protein (cupin superfamily)
MSEQLIQIARRLKKVRLDNDITLEWAAAAFELSPSELKAYESGEEEIPVSFLYMAAKKYGVELSALLTGVEPREQPYVLTPRGKGIMVDRQKEYDYQSLCSEFAHKKIEPLLVTIPIDEGTPPIHFNSHPGQEFHYCLSGRIDVIINNEKITLEPGDSLMFQSEHKHAIRALDQKPAEILVIIV